MADPCYVFMLYQLSSWRKKNKIKQEEICDGLLGMKFAQSMYSRLERGLDDLNTRAEIKQTLIELSEIAETFLEGEYSFRHRAPEDEEEGVHFRGNHCPPVFFTYDTIGSSFSGYAFLKGNTLYTDQNQELPVSNCEIYHLGLSNHVIPLGKGVEKESLVEGMVYWLEFFHYKEDASLCESANYIYENGYFNNPMASYSANCMNQLFWVFQSQK